MIIISNPSAITLQKEEEEGCKFVSHIPRSQAFVKINICEFKFVSYTPPPPPNHNIISMKEGLRQFYCTTRYLYSINGFAGHLLPLFKHKTSIILSLHCTSDVYIDCSHFRWFLKNTKDGLNFTSSLKEKEIKLAKTKASLLVPHRESQL